MHRTEDAFQHISADAHTRFHDEFYKTDLGLGYQGVVPIAKWAEGETQIPFFVALEEEFV